MVNLLTGTRRVREAVGNSTSLAALLSEYMRHLNQNPIRYTFHISIRPCIKLEARRIELDSGTVNLQVRFLSTIVLCT